MQELDDITLLGEYAARDSEEASAALVTRHIDRVYSVALRHTRNPHHAEEITQAVFVMLAQKSKRLRKGIVLEGWLYQTARLTALTRIRSEIRRARREQEAYMQNVANENESPAWREIAPLLDAALAGLNEAERNAVVLRFFYGKSLGEIGTSFGASEDAVRMRINRAIGRLQKFFSRHGVTSTADAVVGTIAANSVQLAPMTLAKSVTATAVTHGTAAGGSTLTLIKGALKIMAWTKAKTAIVAGTILVLAAGTTAMAIRHYGHHSLKKLPMTAANMTLFQRESGRLVNDAKFTTLAGLLFAGSHQNQLPKNFAELNASDVGKNNRKYQRLSDADWTIVASGDKDSFTNPDTTIYFLEKTPRQSPDGKFVRIYATVNGRVFLLMSPGEDFTALEKERGFLIQSATN